MKLYRSQKLVRHDIQVHINSEALLGNVRNLRGLCSAGTKFCAVVKANAYGHGIAEVVNILKKSDVDFFAVSSIYEAVHISEMVEDQSIFLLEPIGAGQDVEQIVFCAVRSIHCAVDRVEAIEHIEKSLAGSNAVLNVHVNIETGMGRWGVERQAAVKLIDRIDVSEHVRLAGVYTHFATADEEDLSYAHEQLVNFEAFLEKTRIRQRDDVLIHAANSAATIKMPEAHFDMVRCGISMYGYYSRPMADPPIRLEPVMKLQGPVVGIKKIPAGTSVSYGRSFVTERDTVAAIVPIGYADGYWRGFSNRAKMKVAEQFVPVIGRVCMDQLLVDVTDVPGVSIGQMVTIIDDSHDSPCGAYGLAEIAGTICYEILINVHAHVMRVVR